MQNYNLTSSVFSFEDLRKGNFLYIDKTEFIWKLVQPYRAMYFLSRPRRFGKSLALSTFKAVFEGKKELFKGLAMYSKPYSWQKYPVIHLDMGGRKCNTVAELELSLREALGNIASELGLAVRGENAQTQFENLIVDASRNAPAVVLVDEYDKPLLGNITTPERNGFLQYLKGFYSVIKSRSELIRFAFVTGVSKFCHVSLFSDLNSLMDLTQNPHYATMFGYTQTELEHYFDSRIREVSKKRSITVSELCKKLKAWYDGFCFSGEAESVYNPVSIAMFFENDGIFDNYWFSTGRPAFLMKLAKEKDFDFEKVLETSVTSDAFSAYEIDRIDPLVLLVQTGYLTIKSTAEDFGMRLYRLGFPNQEVASSFRSYLLNAYTPYTTEQINSCILNLARAVRSGNVNEFMEIWKTWMAKIPYDIQLRSEKYYQNIFYMMFTSLQGIISEAECRTNRGRIDAVVGCGNWLYIVEFKLDKTPEIALQQIRDNEYFVRFRDCGKKIVLIGANVDFENRQLSGWVHEELNT